MVDDYIRLWRAVLVRAYLDSARDKDHAIDNLNWIRSDNGVYICSLAQIKHSAAIKGFMKIREKGKAAMPFEKFPGGRSDLRSF